MTLLRRTLLNLMQKVAIERDANRWLYKAQYTFIKVIGNEGQMTQQQQCLSIRLPNKSNAISILASHLEYSKDCYQMMQITNNNCPSPLSVASQTTHKLHTSPYDKKTKK